MNSVFFFSSSSRFRREARVGGTSGHYSGRIPRGHPRSFSRALSLIFIATVIVVAVHLRLDVQGQQKFYAGKIYVPVSPAPGQGEWGDASLEKNASFNYNQSNRSAPPDYLPLAQHLKHINQRKTRPSLRDMVYGAQRRSMPDLKTTNNKDLKKCARCVLNSIQLSAEEITSENQLKLGRMLMTLVRFYNVSSLLMVPCIPESEWIFTTVKALRDVEPSFKFHCAVSKGFDMEDMSGLPGSPDVKSTNFVVYRPLKEHGLPRADMMFTWRGLEKHGLDEIHNVFKQAVLSGVKYTLVGNSPGLANAKLVEAEAGTYAVVRPERLELNVRAYPFGFNEAMRVIPVNKRQLLLYRTEQMRESW